MKTTLTAVNAHPNEYGRIPGGIYRFTFAGVAYTSHHIANTPQGLEETFVLDIEPAAVNLFDHAGYDCTFYDGATLSDGRFLACQAFGARLERTEA